MLALEFDLFFREQKGPWSTARLHQSPAPQRSNKEAITSVLPAPPVKPPPTPAQITAVAFDPGRFLVDSNSV